jgi:hypothetical protein
MTFSIDSTELIYLVLGPGILILIALLLRHDLRLKVQCEALKARLTETEDRLSVLQNSLSDDSRERDLESRVTLLTRQHEQLMLRDSETGPHFRAVRYAGNGASVEALIEQTGVTRAEAELIVSLHGERQTAGPGSSSDEAR